MLWWTAQSLAISAILAGIVWIVCRLGRLGPVACHALWLLVLLKLLTPPLVFWPWAIGAPFVAPKHQVEPIEFTSSFTPTEIDQAPVIDEPAIPAQTTTVASAASAQPSSRPDAHEMVRIVRHVFSFSSILRALPAIWLAGAIGLALLQSIRIARMLALVHRGTAPSSKLADRVGILSRRLRLRRVDIRMVPGIDSPLIWCLARSQLLWPADLSLDLSAPVCDGLILHELAHIRRRDHLVGWLELVAGCIWWWNPLYWYVRHQLRENAELACDGWVTGLLPGGRRAYGEALLNICEFMSRRSAPMPAVGINTGGRRFLERRLAMILRDQVPLRLPRLGLLALGLLATLTLPAWSQKFEEPAEATQRVKVFTAYSGLSPAPATPLPAGAQEVLDQFNREQADIRREADEKIAQARQRTLDHLKELQDQYAKSGQLDEAVAIRDRIREMQSLAERPRQPMEDPGNLAGFRDHVGQTFLFVVTGNSDGTVWGNDVYTDDSPLGVAAVHAGVLKNGERGVIRVTILPGMQTYQGAERNGVTTQSYGPWQGSYRVEPQLHSYREPPTQPINLMQLRDRVGQTFQYNVVGSDSGTIWGDEVYTDDSPIAVAAVHAGLLRPGQRGLVTIKILPGQGSYTGSTRNGVTSQTYQNWDGSYTFVTNPAPVRRSYWIGNTPGGSGALR